MCAKDCLNRQSFLFLDMFYKEQTSDIHLGLKRHNSKLDSATKDGAQWILLWLIGKISGLKLLIWKESLIS